MSQWAPLLIETLHDEEVEAQMKIYEEIKEKVSFSRKVEVVHGPEKFILFHSAIDEGIFHGEGGIYFPAMCHSKNLPPCGIGDVQVCIGGVKIGGIFQVKRHRLLTKTRFDGKYGEIWLVGFNTMMIHLRIGPFSSQEHFDFFLEGSCDGATLDGLQVSCRPFFVPDSRYNFWQSVLTSESNSALSRHDRQPRLQDKNYLLNGCPPDLIRTTAAALRESILVDLHSEITKLRNDLSPSRDLTISAVSLSWRGVKRSVQLAKFPFQRQLIREEKPCDVGVYFDNPSSLVIPALDLSLEICMGGIAVSRFELSRETLVPECFYYDDGWFNMMAKLEDIHILFNIKPIIVEHSSWEFERDEEVVETSNGSICSHTILEIFHDLIDEGRVAHFELALEEGHFSVDRFEGLVEQIESEENGDKSPKCRKDQTRDCCSERESNSFQEGFSELRDDTSAAHKKSFYEILHSISPAKKIGHFASCATSKVLMAILGGLHADYYYM